MTFDGSAVDRHRFTLSDFGLTVLAGFAGSFVAAVAVAPLSDRAALVVASLLGQDAGRLLGLWAVIRRRSSSFGALGLHVEASDGVYVLAGVVLQIAVAAAFIPVADWVGAERSSQTISEQIPVVEGALLQAGLVLSLALLVPVTEELMFRGLLPRVLRRWMGPWPAYASAALMFALLHLIGVDPDGFLESLVFLVPQLFIVGLILGWQVMRRRRLGVAVFMHSGFNLVAVLALLIAPETFS